MKIRYTARARTDIEDIHSYIAERHPGAARRVRESILATIGIIARYPHLGLKNARSPELRTRLVSRYPYRVHYTVHAGEVIVLHVRHTSRNPLDEP